MDFRSRPGSSTGNDQIDWVMVAEVIGAQAKMVLDYLRAYGIRAIVIESSSIGLLTGANSVGRVLVPAVEVGQALDLLEPEDDGEGEVMERLDETDAALPALHKTVLGATAIIFSPLGAGIAYALSGTAGHEAGSAEVDCPVCNATLELTADEVAQRRFVCPDCTEVIRLDEVAVCPSCHGTWELSAEERAQGWFICGDCRRAVRIASFD